MNYEMINKNLYQSQENVPIKSQPPGSFMVHDRKKKFSYISTEDHLFLGSTTYNFYNFRQLITETHHKEIALFTALPPILEKCIYCDTSQ